MKRLNGRWKEENRNRSTGFLRCTPCKLIFCRVEKEVFRLVAASAWHGTPSWLDSPKFSLSLDCLDWRPCSALESSTLAESWAAAMGVPEGRTREEGGDSSETGSLKTMSETTERLDIYDTSCISGQQLWMKKRSTYITDQVLKMVGGFGRRTAFQRV